MVEKITTRDDREMLDPTIGMYGAVFHALYTFENPIDGRLTIEPIFQEFGLDPEIIGRCVGFILKARGDAAKLNDLSFMAQLEKAIFPKGSIAEERNKLSIHAKIGCLYIERAGLYL